MITTKIKFNGTKVRLGPGVGFRKYQMLALGQFAVDTIKARVAKGIGSDDASMPALADRYKKRKTGYGLQPIRDLTGPGQTSYMARTFSKPAPGMLRSGRSYTTARKDIRFRSAGGGAHPVHAGRTAAQDLFFIGEGKPADGAKCDRRRTFCGVGNRQPG